MPTTFTTVNDVLSLPLKNFVFGIGDINQPPAFQRDQADHDNLLHFYWQDTWKLAAAIHAELWAGVVV